MYIKGDEVSSLRNNPFFSFLHERVKGCQITVVVDVKSPKENQSNALIGVIPARFFGAYFCIFGRF